ncbi:alanine racemase [Herbaspirillum sp. RTI4]|uniref:alanine racemase n=1 Tax=Herbaspirillum sp. RTI4 TaxID=3048640 RepID=UPI002AB46CDD|nr:alanine racemase [Herbaspirillum sp. RTI4]MDY7578654.1 alanine racemase [Herbaspirillum sp. RTI4]MEA9980648.1 alanine racemase [Herbaspirillum sp. RTI4]
MPRPLIATIDINALSHNLSVARAHAPLAKVWAVVKANAYGHGLERGLRGFATADGLALIEPENAVRLREMGWDKEILLLEGFFEPIDIALLVQHRLQFAVHCTEQIAMLEAAGLGREAQLHVHLKMNSGMNRLGFRPDQYRAAYERVRRLSAVQNITLMTHFANADDADNPALPLAEQVRRFEQATQGLPDPRSLCNSAADLLHAEIGGQWIRPGVMLYGATPGGSSAQEFGLRPAMTLSSEVIGIQDLLAGDAVGYGSRFVAHEAMRIGIVACGYADGYPRHASTGGPVVVDDVRTRLLGGVSMDMLCVDLSTVPGGGMGSKVCLWGESMPIDEVAHAAGTIGYELMCALAPRVRVQVLE